MVLSRLSLILIATVVLFPAYAVEQPHEGKHASPTGLLQLSPAIRRFPGLTTGGSDEGHHH